MDHKKVKLNIIKEYIVKSITAKTDILNDEENIKSIIHIAKKIILTFRSGGKLIFAGNGGSAADAQHLSAEFVGKFNFNRPALPSISLTTNTSTITAIGNDYSYKYIFSRQVEALANKKDVLILISTSGNSENLIKAALSAKKKGVHTFCFLGNKGGKISKIVEDWIIVNSNTTSIIQESHIMLGHLICLLVEDAIFNN